MNAAINNKLPQAELPAKLIIISDMEFNACVRNAEVTNFNEFSANVPDSIFSVPSGYKEITEDNISALAGLMGSF